MIVLITLKFPLALNFKKHDGKIPKFDTSNIYLILLLNPERVNFLDSVGTTTKKVEQQRQCKDTIQGSLKMLESKNRENMKLVNT